MFTQEELRVLEEQSDENMLFFYEDEMRHTLREGSPSSFLSKSLIDRFIEVGILERRWGRKTWKLMLSRKGRMWYGLPV